MQKHPVTINIRYFQELLQYIHVLREQFKEKKHCGSIEGFAGSHVFFDFTMNYIGSINVVPTDQGITLSGSGTIVVSYLPDKVYIYHGDWFSDSSMSCYHYETPLVRFFNGKFSLGSAAYEIFDQQDYGILIKTDEYLIAVPVVPRSNFAVINSNGIRFNVVIDKNSEWEIIEGLKISHLTWTIANANKQGNYYITVCIGEKEAWADCFYESEKKRARVDADLEIAHQLIKWEPGKRQYRDEHGILSLFKLKLPFAP